MVPSQNTVPAHDLIGVGFGPSNLALAIALAESRPPRRAALASLYLERQQDYRWHGNTIVEHSRLQVSFLKDLVSLRNPTSPFSFINFMHESGRLQDFINLQTFFPYRYEFDRYLRWAAAHFAEQCAYGENVLRIEPVHGKDRVVREYRVISRDAQGVEQARATRSVVIGSGGSARIPKAFAHLGDDPRVFHYTRYLDGVARLGLEQAKTPRRVAVVGAGQSAAEAFIDLHERFPNVSVDIVSRGFALRPSDDSPFVNEVFNPEATDLVYRKSREAREAWINAFKATNYSVIDPDMIGVIYEIFYRQKMTAQDRHELLRACEIQTVTADADGIELQGRDHLNERSFARRYDAVVLATGFERAAHRQLLEPVADMLDDFQVTRDYRLVGDERLAAPLFVVGYAEQSHGLSDTLLSVLSVRAQEIANAVYGALADDAESCADRGSRLMALGELRPNKPATAVPAQ